MRKPRIKNDGEGYYHIVSRCALQQFLLSPEGKSVFVDMLRRIAIFSGIDVFPAEKIQEIIDKKGELPLQILLRCKVRHFICGAIFGSKDFVDEQVAKHKYAFSLGRKTGARGIGLCKNWDGIKLYSARDLQKSPVSFQG